MISPMNMELLQNAIEAVRQRRETQRTEAVSSKQAIEQAALKPAAGSSQMGAKTQAKPKAKAAAKPKPKTAAKTPGADSTITPYLTSRDLAEVGDRTADYENTDAAARNTYATAAANAVRASGDIERGRVQNVSAANNNAAARGIFQSGIRAGNVGIAESAAARGQSAVTGGLSLASAQTTAARNAAKQQLNAFMQTVAARAAENGAALPVDPYSGNVKGAATLRKTTTKPQVKR